MKIEIKKLKNSLYKSYEAIINLNGKTYFAQIVTSSYMLNSDDNISKYCTFYEKNIINNIVDYSTKVEEYKINYNYSINPLDEDKFYIDTLNGFIDEFVRSNKVPKLTDKKAYVAHFLSRYDINGNRDEYELKIEEGVYIETENYDKAVMIGDTPKYFKKRIKEFGYRDERFERYFIEDNKDELRKRIKEYCNNKICLYNREIEENNILIKKYKDFINF